MKILKLATALILLFAPGLCFQPNSAAEETYLWEGFEQDLAWIPVDWENVGQVELYLSDEMKTQGDYALAVDTLPEQVEWKNKVVFSKEEHLNLEDARILMDIYAPSSQGFSVAIGFDTGDDWVFYESATVPLDEGWNRDVIFDLDSIKFKCRASNWKYTQQLQDKDNIKKVHIMIYRPAKMEVQTVYIDNIRLK